MKKFLNILLIIVLSIFINTSVFAEEPADETNSSKEQIEQTTTEEEIDPEAESIINDTNNPIEYDASQENINDKNFTPKAKPEEPKEKVKKEKPKKEKKNKDKGKKEVKADEKANETVDGKTSEQSGEQTNEQDNLNFDSEEKSGGADGIEYQEPVKKKTYSQDDYEQMYRDMPVPTHTYVHGVDPDQYYDMKDSMWSPYPLLRLNAPIYFKTITIPPGYYLLTPREYKGDWYILFKESGCVKYTIPAFSKDFVDEFYYRDHLKEMDMTKSQRWQIKFLNAWGKYIRKSKRKPAIKTNLELTDLDNNFLLIELYYGAHKYSMIFRVEKY